MGSVCIPFMNVMILSYYCLSEGQGFILVYSITSRSTFDRLEVFRQSMLRAKKQKPIFILVGNKCDKIYEREVSKDEGAALARSFGCSFLETSAKTAQNVELLFTNLVRALRMELGGFHSDPWLRGSRRGGASFCDRPVFSLISFCLHLHTTRHPPISQKTPSAHFRSPIPCSVTSPFHVESTALKYNTNRCKILNGHTI